MCRRGPVALFLGCLCLPLVALTQSSAAASLSTTVLRLTPERAYGKGRSEDAKVLPRKLAIDSRGNVFVFYAHADNATIHAFDSTGRYIDRVARNGRGPGEVMGAWAMGPLGDSIWVVDNSLARVLMFGAPRPTQTMLEAFAYDSSRRVVFSPIGLFSDGTWLRSKANADQTIQRFEKVSRDGKTTVHLLDGECPGQLSAMIDGRKTFFSSRFLRCEDVILDHSGKNLYRVDGRPAKSEDDAAIVIQQIGLDAKIRWTKRFGYTPIPLTKQDREPPARMPEEGRKLIIASLPRFQPAVNAVFAGRDGTLFLQREWADTVQYDVIGADGTSLGRILLPSEATLMEGEATHVWVLEERDDEMVITRYRIDRGR
jgi:hypothetical protein